SPPDQLHRYRNSPVGTRLRSVQQLKALRALFALFLPGRAFRSEADFAADRGNSAHEYRGGEREPVDSPKGTNEFDEA
ncbi:hypothetical protein, partial [Glycomyces buryatensis]|uniref:hypothetical protein n=1 Tax=Glycomyces buryatensis TaxID=2570927 RepID=UPI001B3C1483